MLPIYLFREEFDNCPVNNGPGTPMYSVNEYFFSLPAICLWLESDASSQHGRIQAVLFP